MIVIGRAPVARQLTYEVCIPLMRQAMIALSQGRTRQILRSILDLGEGNALGVMPGAVEGAAFGAKLVSVYPGNFAKGGPSHQGVITLFDPADGAPICLVDAGEVTAIRTAAASAAATDVLARADARHLAILSYGEQAWKWAGSAAQPGGETFSAAGVFHDNLEQADPEKKKSFVDSILSGQYHNQAAEGVESALSCMMARHAAYTGDEVTYAAIANSSEHWEDHINLNQFA